MEPSRVGEQFSGLLQQPAQFIGCKGTQSQTEVYQSSLFQEHPSPVRLEVVWDLLLAVRHEPSEVPFAQITLPKGSLGPLSNSPSATSTVRRTEALRSVKSMPKEKAIGCSTIFSPGPC